MPLDVEIAMINTIEDQELVYSDLNDPEAFSWHTPPPDKLRPFQYCRCTCSGPSSGYEIALKYNGLICTISVTSWGVQFKKSTPTHNDMELIQIKEKAPYRLELFLI
ncbi:hypothetical protein [Sneathiella limimaris]|uniref:hypothetical protein n=1 Tax=Sneathiella limimaris TaxID=1964213 RepID=UPI00146CCA0B|nr:hypothetical protein [Sneathiella limimaris]